MNRCVLLVAMLASDGLFAAELVVRDVHVGVSTGSSAFDYTFKGTTGDATGQDAGRSLLAPEIGGRWSFTPVGRAYGLVVGADVRHEVLTYGDGGLTTTWGRVCAGVGWALDDRWQVVAELGGLYGRSAFDHPATARASDFTASGRASGFDLRLGSTWMVTRSLGLGVMGGWQRLGHRLGDGPVDLAIDRTGWLAGAELVWRFSSVPTRLE